MQYQELNMMEEECRFLLPGTCEPRLVLQGART